MKTLEQAVSISLKNVLLATDFSEGSEKALKYAQAIAHRYGSRVHTVHVSGPDSYQLLEPDAFALTFDSPAGGSASLTNVLQGLLQGLPTQTPLQQGAVWKVISDVAERNEIDLLVLASHGRQGIPRLLLGSVAEDVFRNVSCPVLTVGPDVKTCNAPELSIREVLLATQFEPDSAAPWYAARLCDEFRAKLTVLHVSDERHKDRVTQTPAEFARQLYSVIPEEPALWQRPTFLLDYGVPSAKILEVAHRVQPDMIVLGARHPEPAPINSHLPWATAARVIAEAECPVLTVRQEGNDAYL